MNCINCTCERCISERQKLKPEPEKWVACGNPHHLSTGTYSCNLKKGHVGPCGYGEDFQTRITPTCVHCGKDPKVKSQEQLDSEAYSQWEINRSGHPFGTEWFDAFKAGIAHARNEGLK